MIYGTKNYISITQYTLCVQFLYMINIKLSYQNYLYENYYNYLVWKMIKFIVN